MARRRYISTEISTDKKVNKLALQYGDFAVMLYTWMFPHAEDNCEITGDPEELKFIVCPGRTDKTEDDVKKAIEGMAQLKLIIPFERDEKPMILIPPKSFYKYQTYISHGNRDVRGIEERSAKQNAENHRESPQNTVSPSPSPFLSPSPIPINNINDFFERVWKLYPRKEGKGSVSKTQKEKLLKDVGEEQLIRCIERYKADKEGTEYKYLKQGSTFFNSGYVDYLDANYTATPKLQPQQSKAPNKGNFEQRKYDDGYFDKLYKDV